MVVTGSSVIPWSFWLQAPLDTTLVNFLWCSMRNRALSRGQFAVHCPIVLHPAPPKGFSTLHLIIAFFFGILATVLLVIVYILLQ